MEGDYNSIQFVEPQRCVDLFDLSLSELRNYVTAKNFSISGKSERELLRLAVLSYKMVSNIFFT